MARQHSKSTKQSNRNSRESPVHIEENSQDKVATDLEEEKIKEFGLDVQHCARRMAQQSIPFRELKGLIDEFSVEEKRRFCQKLITGVPISKSMKFTSAKLITLLRSKNMRAEQRFDVYVHLLKIMSEIFREHKDIMQASILLDNEDSLRENHGDWHYYFSLLLWPVENEFLQQRANELSEELLGQNSKSESEQTQEANKSVSISTTKDDNKERELINLERKLRIEMQEKNDKLKVELLKMQQLYDEQLKSNDVLAQTNLTLSTNLNAIKNKYDDLYRHHQELSRTHQKIVRDHEELSRDFEALTRDYEKLNQIVDQAAATAELHSQETTAQPVTEVQQPASSIPTEPIMTKTPTYSLVEWHEYYYNAMKTEINHIFQLSLQDTSFLEQNTERERIKEYFDMLAILEGFKPKLTNLNPITFTLEKDDVYEDDHHLFIEAMAENGENHSTYLPEEILGKFMRLSQGGYIELENEQKVYVSETVVNTVGIEHNALVEGILHTNGQYRYTVLLQGDDSESDVTQLIGYVKEELDYAFSCVDINTGKIYSIHHRDAERWDIVDGDTGVFNIATGESAVRISRIDKDHSQSSLSLNKSVKKSKENDLSESEEDHFLEGCKIVIVGGVEKWFTETIAPTGADLIHNTGSNPSRVYPDIKTADAVFLLLSANSHNATWGAVETAKRYNVPHFTIKGSRSSLLNLLREKQDIIRRRHLENENSQ